MRQRLSLVVWLVVLPISMGTSLIAARESKRLADQQIERQMLATAAIVANWFDWWEQDQLAAMKFLAKRGSIEGMDIAAARKTLRDAYQYLPSYSFFLLRPDGRLLASTGSIKKANQLNDLDRLVVAKGATSSILRRPDVSEACYYHGVRLKNQHIISSCIALRHLGSITGISKLSESAGNVDPASVQKYDQADSREGELFHKMRYGVLLLTKQGEAASLSNSMRSQLFETADRTSLPLLPSPLLTLAMESKQLKADSKFGILRKEGKTFYYAIQQRGNGDAFILLSEQGFALGSIRLIMAAIWYDDLIAFGLIAILVFVIGSSMTRPFEQVGSVLASISHGDFSQRLPVASGQVGKLFNDVNQASQQMEAYVASSKAHAVTDAQLKEAQRMQADFLIDELPSSDTLELSASFDPAYQIGADWYDAIVLDGVTFGVVADVCDKGIPSALYMSVFRSLLRIGLQRNWHLSNGNAAETLSTTLTGVNTYMAQTHARSGMFATAFVFAYDEKRQQLTHVVAGHELPLIWHDGQINQLALGGPALGLFETATFTTHQCTLVPGELLLAFSDGLTDARDAEGQSFGIERVKTLLHSRAQQGCSAEELRQAMERAVKAHIGKAEQFDDVTLLTLKPRHPGQGGSS